MVSALLIAWSLSPEPPSSWEEVAVVPQTCSVGDFELAWPSVEALIELEDPEVAQPTGGLQLLLRCTPRGIRLAVQRPGMLAETRDVELWQLEPAVIPRLVSLAAVELLERTPTRLRRSEPQDPPVPVQADPLRPLRWQLDLGPELLVFPTTRTWLGGGRLALTHVPGRVLGWRVDAGFDAARSRVTAGDIVVLAPSAGAFGVARIEAGPTRLSFAPGVRGGYAALRGRPTERETVEGSEGGAAWFGPALRVGIDGSLGRRFVLGGELETGWAVIGARARIGARLGPGPASFWISPRVFFGLRW